MCNYYNANSDKVARHLALGHSKLDELLRDRDLVEKKRQISKLKRTTGSTGLGGSGIKCPICDVRDVSSEHITLHFTGELNQYIAAKMPPGGTQCNLCTNFKGEI